MASRASRIYIDTDGQIDEVRRLIHVTFDNLISKLEMRRSELISELEERRKQLFYNESTRKSTVESIDKVIEAFGEVKVNEIAKISQTMESQLKSKKHSYAKRHACINFACNTLELEQKMKNLGKIVEAWEPIYSNLKNATSFENSKYSSTIIEKPMGVCVCEEKQHIYIVDSGKSKIKVFSMDCDFIGEFGEEFKKIWGIAADKNNLYITDKKLQTVHKYDCSSQPVYIKSLTDHSVKLLKPRGIAVDPATEEVYVTDTNLNMVLVFSSELIFQRKFAKEFTYPSDIKIYKDQVYVVDNNKEAEMHLFRKNGVVIAVMKLLNDYTNIEIPLFFFNIDCMGNFLISNWKNNTIDIIDNDGVYNDSIGNETGIVLKTPRGIAVTRSGKVVVVSETHKKCLQILDFS